MPEAEIYAESKKEVNIYAESILPGIRKADEIPLRGRKVAPRASLPDEIPSLRDNPTSIYGTSPLLRRAPSSRK